MSDKLTLDRAWSQCLTMWRQIVRWWRQSGKTANVADLKIRWFYENDPEVYLREDSYFCEYDDQNRHRNWRRCIRCPGRLVDPKFYCGGWCSHPDKFLARLEELDRKRRGK